ncbi:hypothetical protein NQ315_009265 [Exocentrus adspersus]|uniref:Uncharacterized protein n=1 Tax=Exocentrus adspersus TaxID=1586481 RepID=A0AAV8WGT4_9CUCU|nr:hypothetical protein NQ315_009265 [Exocentrus adspersus]
MKLVLYFLLLASSGLEVFAEFYKTNITDLSKCKVHYSRSGSVYSDFYSLSELVEDTEDNNTLVVDFHFAVLAPSDAHILLAPSTSVDKGDPAYEIVIGAGGDTFCDIRRSQKANMEMSPLEGKEKNCLFISWVDPDPLPLKYISFSAWSGIEAKWYFDCERPNDIEDEYKSTIEVHGMTKLTWLDENLTWDPNEYGNMETLHIYRREIWQPDFYLFNAVADGRGIFKDSLMVAHSSGLVEWNPAMYLKAWCALNDMAKWPKDVHECHIILGFIKDFDYTKLDFNRNDSSLLYHDSSEWAVLEADLYSSSDGLGIPVFKIAFTIQRISNTYNTIFFTPFLIISVSLLSTFWVDAFGKMKISLNCAQLILSTVMLLLLGLFIPSHSVSVPYLVMLYSFTLVATVVSVIIAIIVINLSRNNQKSPLPHYLYKALTSKVLRIGLHLPKMDMSEEYGKLNDSFTKSPEKQQLIWILLGIAIDRISFLIYLPLIIYAIYLNY